VPLEQRKARGDRGYRVPGISGVGYIGCRGPALARGGGRERNEEGGMRKKAAWPRVRAWWTFKHSHLHTFIRPNLARGGVATLPRSSFLSPPSSFLSPGPRGGNPSLNANADKIWSTSGRDRVSLGRRGAILPAVSAGSREGSNRDLPPRQSSSSFVLKASVQEERRQWSSAPGRTKCSVVGSGEQRHVSAHQSSDADTGLCPCGRGMSSRKRKLFSRRA
jgi:hypothetical protein